MEEQHGVRPRVVRPQESFPKKTQPLPRNATVMPVGLSANSVGLDGRSDSLRRILLAGVSLLVVLSLCVAVWVFVKQREPLKQKTIVNGLYEYTFLFYKEAEPVNLVAGQGFKYGDEALLIATPTNDDVAKTCEQMNTKKERWKEAFRAKVGGVDRPVCQLGDTIFTVTFFDNRAEHLLEVSYHTPQAVRTDDLRKIIESMKVRVQ